MKLRVISLHEALEEELHLLGVAVAENMLEEEALRRIPS